MYTFWRYSINFSSVSGAKSSLIWLISSDNELRFLTIASNKILRYLKQERGLTIQIPGWVPLNSRAEVQPGSRAGKGLMLASILPVSCHLINFSLGLSFIYLSLPKFSSSSFPRNIAAIQHPDLLFCHLQRVKLLP